MSLLRQAIFGNPPSGLSHRDAQLNCGVPHSCKPSPPSPSLGRRPPDQSSLVSFEISSSSTCDLSMRNLVLVNVTLLAVLFTRPITPPLLCLTRLTKAFFRRSCFSFSSSLLLLLLSSFLCFHSFLLLSSFLCFCSSLLLCSSQRSFSCLDSTSSLLFSISWASYHRYINISNNPSWAPTWASYHFSNDTSNNPILNTPL